MSENGNNLLDKEDVVALQRTLMHQGNVDPRYSLSSQ